MSTNQSNIIEEIDKKLHDYILQIIPKKEIDNLRKQYPNEVVDRIKFRLDDIEKQNREVLQMKESQNKRDKQSMLPIINTSYKILKQLLDD